MELIFTEDFVIKIPGLQDRTMEHEDICRYTDEFERRGGVVKKLPDEKIPAYITVGAKYGIYEKLFEVRSMYKPIRVIKNGQQRKNIDGDGFDSTGDSSE